MIKRPAILTVLIALIAGAAVAQKSKNSGTVLKADNFRHYVDYFNKMEDENIAQAIPNAQSWDWLKANVPLFECPQQNFEEMWYYRWWTLRKHLKQTEQGYVFTEFLVKRNYADKYNLIASALGHHIYEA
ncbi:MAG TPA: glycoside hydrolase, partial [Niastella sp.]